jgi:hypothetical protein
MTRVRTTEADELRSEEDKINGRGLGFIPSFATVLESASDTVCVYHDVRLTCTQSLLSSDVWGGSPLQSKARSHSMYMSYLGRYIFHPRPCTP